MNKAELNYKITIEPTLFGVFEEMAADMPRFGITHEDFLRAIWTWSAELLSAQYPTTPPNWVIDHFAEKALAKEAGVE